MKSQAEDTFIGWILSKITDQKIWRLLQNFNFEITVISFNIHTDLKCLTVFISAHWSNFGNVYSPERQWINQLADYDRLRGNKYNLWKYWKITQIFHRWWTSHDIWLHSKIGGSQKCRLARKIRFSCEFSRIYLSYPSKNRPFLHGMGLSWITGYSKGCALRWVLLYSGEEDIYPQMLQV